MLPEKQALGAPYTARSHLCRSTVMAAWCWSFQPMFCAPILPSILSPGLFSSTLAGLWASKSTSTYSQLLLKLTVSSPCPYRTKGKLFITASHTSSNFTRGHSGVQQSIVGSKTGCQQPACTSRGFPCAAKHFSCHLGTPRCGAIFYLLVLICKDINVPTISK